MPGRVSQNERELRALRDRSPSEDEGDHVAEERNATAGPSRRKRKRMSDMGIEEVFANMDPEEKAKISKEYRRLQAEADDLKANLPNTTVNDLTRKIQEGSKLFEDVRDTALASLDARLMMTTSEAALGIARKMKLEDNAFNVDEFLIRTKALLGLDRAEREDQDSEVDQLDDGDDRGATGRGGARKGPLGDWEAIGWMAAKWCRRAPGVEFMYGPIDTAVKRRNQTQRQRRTQVAPETRPQEIQTQSATQEADTMKDTMANVRRVAKILQKADPDGRGINFFQLIINPDDFGQSVENCFYVSFLIHQGNAGIVLQPDGMILIQNRTPNDAEAGDTEVARNQAVIELTMDTWNEAKRLFNITKSLIPHRVYAETGPLAGNTWYR
ncbi:Nse4 C-terminal-domain-containing protein [Papiliotrema laurentii]|uniref:Non-structural maintenance of chromosomes element 4 n=1 Tax=Papiliotrema laurentii TaxID=5418 RepID=A0AAD9FQM7_PAPLA|nr:Nse4 C-terminal-domain-containing protein [Papiliotrema laurentii]